MDVRLAVIILGALLVFVGLLLMAYKAIWQGRLSGASRRDSIVESTTLEPRGRSAAFDPKANWLGIALIALGTIFLLVGTVYS
jgi:dipeptide/tripeptide permease